jgi:hypothetical protein
MKGVSATQSFGDSPRVIQFIICQLLAVPLSSFFSLANSNRLLSCWIVRTCYYSVGSYEKDFVQLDQLSRVGR